MSKLNHTTKINPCEICGKTNGNCRYNENLILCMSLDDQIKGYKNLGYTKDGLWIKYIKDDGSFDHERKERHQRLKEQSQADAIARLKGALLRTHRDQHLRVISSHLGLKDSHREDLINRGLNDEQIKQRLYFSVTKGQNIIPESIPLNFPAVTKDYRFSNGRKALYSPVTGYACVIFDSFGRAIGLQFRDEDKDADNKYKWLGKDGQSKLKNNELPLNIVNPFQDEDLNWSHLKDKNSNFNTNNQKVLPHNTALLCEGILKSHIAGFKHNCLTIGASGGLFSNHQQQFLATVKRLGITSVVVTPDGGDLINQQVRRRWSDQIKWLKTLGLNVSVAWWEQWHKEDAQDLDEIADFSKVKLLTPSEFFKLSTYHAKAKYNWRKSKRFKPDLKINQQYLNLETPALNTLTAVKSALATGKTTNVIEWLKELKNEPIIYLQYRNSLNIGFVQKVNSQLGEEFIKYINDYEVVPRNQQGKLDNLALCLDSLFKLKDEDFDGCNLILDEAISDIKHLLFSATLNSKRQLIINKFEQAILRAKRVILLDGNLTNWAVDYISKIDKNKQIIKIENIFKPKKQQVFYLNGEYELNKKGKINGKSSYYTKLLEYINNSARVGVCADSQHFLETLERLALKNNPELKILRVDSLTKAEQGMIECYHNGRIITINEVELFLANPDGYLARNNIDLFLYSPTCESGVDISIKDYFASHFCFFFGILDVDSILQMIKRIRDDIPRYIWVRTWSSGHNFLEIKSPFPEMIGKTITNIIQEEISNFNLSNLPNNLTVEQLKEKLIKIIDNSLNCHYETQNYIKAFQNYEKANLRDCVRERLIATDYLVTDITAPIFTNNEDEFRGISEEIKQEKSQDIFEANYLQVETNLEHLSKDSLPWKRDDRSSSKPDRVGVENLLLRQTLPKIETTKIWSQDLIYELNFKDKKLIKRLELYYLYRHPDILKNMQSANYFSVLKQERVSLHHLRLTHRFINALYGINLESILTLERYNQDSPEILAIYQTLKSNRQLQDDLGISVGDSTPCEVVGRILSKLNIKTKSRQVKIEGKPIRFYCVDLPDANQQNLILLDCIGERLSKFSGENFNLEWENLEKPVTEEKTPEANQDEALSRSHLNDKNDNFNTKSDQVLPEIWQIFKAITQCRACAIAHCQDRFMSLAQFPLDLISESFLALEKINLPLVEKLVELGFYDFMAQF